MPFSTRDGKAEAPMEPGARWNIEPWVAWPPRKWWRLTTPWKPLPLLMPTTVMLSPGRTARRALVADLGFVLLVDAQLAQYAAGRQAGLGEVSLHGFRDAATGFWPSTKPIWIAE
jgi:hypothetical protein